MSPVPTPPANNGHGGERNPVVAWTEALDQFEERLGGFRAALENDSPSAVTGMWPDAELIGVPLPAELAERAQDLMTEAKKLEGQIVTRQQELGPPRPPARQRRKTPVSSFITEL
jgi:hypothetical protein